jgi:3-dehydrosphinganine reductase
MAKQGVCGSIVLTSSVLGFFAVPGYSAYTAVKHAIRGLAESLRIEFLLYKINVHCYFPATIYSPGFEEEQKSKPELTKIIEGADEGLTPEQCALRLVRGKCNLLSPLFCNVPCMNSFNDDMTLFLGIEKGHVMITSDPIGHLFRNSMRGMSPVSNYILDPIFAAVAPVSSPFLFSLWKPVLIENDEELDCDPGLEENHRIPDQISYTSTQERSHRSFG